MDPIEYLRNLYDMRLRRFWIERRGYGYSIVANTQDPGVVTPQPGERIDPLPVELVSKYSRQQQKTVSVEWHNAGREFNTVVGTGGDVTAAIDSGFDGRSWQSISILCDTGALVAFVPPDADCMVYFGNSGDVITTFPHFIYPGATIAGVRSAYAANWVGNIPMRYCTLLVATSVAGSEYHISGTWIENR